MMKKIIGITLLVAVVAVLAFGAINRTIAKSETSTDEFGTGNGHGYGNSRLEITSADVESSRGAQNDQEHTVLLDTLPTGILDQSEIDALQFMLEEEKLARDVYAALYEIWGQPLFQNISSSEQTHMNAISDVIERYDLTALASDQPGVFVNADLQALYKQLIAQGSQTLPDALLVGGAIEELDILDLQASMAKTDQVDIQSVFENLENGSYRHLSSFAANYSRQTGINYQAQYMSAEDYQNSISITAGNGRGQGSNGSGRQGN